MNERIEMNITYYKNQIKKLKYAILKVSDAEDKEYMQNVIDGMQHRLTELEKELEEFKKSLK